MLFTRGESGASPDEFAAVMRAMAQLGTESHPKYQQEE
jgi:hypothetical protein